MFVAYINKMLMGNGILFIFIYIPFFGGQAGGGNVDLISIKKIVLNVHLTVILDFN